MAHWGRNTGGDSCRRGDRGRTARCNLGKHQRYWRRAGGCQCGRSGGGRCNLHHHWRHCRRRGNRCRRGGRGRCYMDQHRSWWGRAREGSSVAGHGDGVACSSSRPAGRLAGLVAARPPLVCLLSQRWPADPEQRTKLCGCHWGQVFHHQLAAQKPHAAAAK